MSFGTSENSSSEDDEEPDHKSLRPKKKQKEKQIKVNPSSPTDESGQARVDLSLHRSVLHRLPVHGDQALGGPGLQPQGLHLLVHQVRAAARRVAAPLHGEEEAEQRRAGDPRRHVKQVDRPVVRARGAGRRPQVLGQMGLVNGEHQDEVLLPDHGPALWDRPVQARKQRVLRRRGSRASWR